MYFLFLYLFDTSFFCTFERGVGLDFTDIFVVMASNILESHP